MIPSMILTISQIYSTLVGPGAVIHQAGRRIGLLV
jgi:hypothetical protein